MSFIVLSTLENPVDKSYIDSRLGRDSAFDEEKEIVRGEVVVLKDGFEKKLSGAFWIYDNERESFQKQVF